MHRRRFLRTTFEGSAALFVSLPFAGCAPVVGGAAADASCLPRTEDNIEGPFFLAGAPDRSNLMVAGEPGVPLAISGVVRDGGCRPIAGAVIEVWHADANGEYDNAGYVHRGVLRCDPAGRYDLATIVPGHYLNGPTYRPAHVHMKVYGHGQPVLTTQLYFPGDPYNDNDPFIRSSLLLSDLRTQTDGSQTARFDFVL